MNTTVEFTLDIPCVWSYFAFARLRRALDRFRADGGRTQIVFRPYQLSPEATAAGELKTEVLRRAFGGDPADAVAEITARAAEEGLEFRHERAIFSNTFEAHRLIGVAAAQGRAEEMVERLFRAHHTDELNIADVEVLKGLAAEAGVEWSDEGADATRRELDRVRGSGVRGVPVLRFGGRPQVSGALPEEEFLAALRESAAPRPAVHTPVDGADLAALRRLVTDIEDGFNGKRAAILDRPFAADAVVVVPDGTMIRGWDDLFAYHTARLAGPVADWRTRVTLLDAVSPSPGTAVLHLRQETTGPDLAFANHGTVVAVRRDGAWWIGALQNTNVA
ncbi:SgcJ/EcaC family oxidoreductase [Actinomadura sediminis]|uniref:SgcJ/EcaC family oxidoreductase n=1 Tax=Actinomadura sediminis TaxID=1038904 RepID=A0ABW3EGP4_9ACTN